MWNLTCKIVLALESSMGGQVCLHKTRSLSGAMKKNFVASLSCGKDSLAMVLRLMEEGKTLTHCVFYDTGMEFQSIYHNIEKIKPILADYGCEFTILSPKQHFLYDMLLRTVNEGTDRQHYGYEWCGGCTRWRTTNKIQAINKYLAQLGNYVQYIGIAADEPSRVKEERNKVYPLVEWEMTEKDCLTYCYSKGWNWQENGVELYDVLDRVSCWCCTNKNLKELKNMYYYLPHYWNLLKALQSRIDRAFSGRYTVFQLEERFKREGMQMSLFDYI